MKTIRNSTNHRGWNSILMQMMLAAIVVSMVSITSCQKEDQITPSAALNENAGLSAAPAAQGLITVSGILKEASNTSYQYGSHELIVPGQPTKYAIRSNFINLAKFVGKNVEIKAFSISGYPVDGGPPYLDVIAIKQISQSKSEPIFATGKLIEVQKNTYQYKYGWGYQLVVPGSPVTYFLKSANINMDKYVGKTVKIAGQHDAFVPDEMPAYNNSGNMRWSRVTYYLNVNWIMSLAIEAEEPLMD